MDCSLSLISEKKEILSCTAKYKFKSFVMTFVIACFLYVMFASHMQVHLEHSEGSEGMSKKSLARISFVQLLPSIPTFKATPRHKIPVYYINMKASIERRNYTESLLSRKGFNYHRVEAITEEEIPRLVQKDVTSVPNILRPNEKEAGCLASHLYALYQAAHDDDPSPFALIVEDDIRFEFEVDWEALIATAPSDFSILQIATSNFEMVEKLWYQYGNDTLALRGGGGGLRGREDYGNLWFRRNLWQDPLWSTQGYLVNKTRIREEIDRFVEVDEVSGQVKRISFLAPKMFYCNPKPCVLPFRVVADIYLYFVFGPSYMSRIPIINGARSEDHEGIGSYIQSTRSVDSHRKQFQQIIDLVQYIQNTHPSLVPPSLHFLSSRR